MIHCSMDDVVAVAPTGGTTGAPKGVMNANRVFQTFFAQRSVATSYRPGEPVVNLADAPMTHSAGMLTPPCSARGGTVVIPTRPDPTFLMDALERRADRMGQASAFQDPDRNAVQDARISRRPGLLMFW
jgi:long-subunit acyl-CoA synthetase (AMP-forming)